MQIIVASNNDSITDYLRELGYNVRSLYANDLALKALHEFSCDVVIYFSNVNAVIPHEEAIKSIIGLGRRIILIVEPDNPLLLYSVALGNADVLLYPVEPEALLYRLKNPATTLEAAEIVRNCTQQNHSIPADTTIKMVHLNACPKNDNDKKNILDWKKVLQKVPWLLRKPVAQVFTSGGLVSVDTIDELIKGLSGVEFIFIPAGWGIEAVRRLRREIGSRAVHVVVIGGNKEYLQAGADRCVKRVTKEVVEESAAMARRLQELWSRAETDPLTGCYARRFWDAWLNEQHRAKRPFAVALIDLDHFKSVNDTYGHQAGDVVLATFGDFLRTSIRAGDVTARYGGEEFVVGLPYADAHGTSVLVDRLRQEWSKQRIPLSSGEIITCTFSAGVADGCEDVMKQADHLLYEAKNIGRNRVQKQESKNNKLLILGQGPTTLMPVLRKYGVYITTDPADANMVLSDYATYRYAPPGLPLVVLGTGTVADFAIIRERTDTILAKSHDDAVIKIRALVKGETLVDKKLPESEQARKLTVLPGRATERGQTLKNHSSLYVVCPSRPGLTGEVSARLSTSIEGCALVCAAPDSTGALALGIPNEKLIISDWRIPGSTAPVEWQGIQVWPIDPCKFLNIKEPLHGLVEQIRHRFNLIIVDCGGSMDICARAPKTDGILLLRTSGDLSDQAVDYWLKNYGGPNVLVMAPVEVPDIVATENGFLLMKQPGNEKISLR